MASLIYILRPYIVRRIGENWSRIKSSNVHIAKIGRKKYESIKVKKQVQYIHYVMFALKKQELLVLQLQELKQPEHNKSPSKTKRDILCFGISDEVFDSKSHLVGHVGFHDYDGYILRKTLETMVCEFSKETDTTIDCLKTGYGYHFVVFEILDDSRYNLWKELSQNIFPSDYKTKLPDNRPLDRVLRISPKGNTMRPTFLFRDYRLIDPIHPRVATLSMGHIETYRQVGIVDIDTFMNWFIALMPTKVRLCTYLTGHHKKEEKKEIET